MSRGKVSLVHLNFCFAYKRFRLRPTINQLGHTMPTIKIKQANHSSRAAIRSLTKGRTWYIAAGNYCYLHADLKWRQYAESYGAYSGWYKSRQEARETLAAWYDKVLKTED